MGYIYKIVNKVNKKMYIGQTYGDLQERWRCHLKKNSNCLYLKHALQKYGKENFDFQLICICFDDDLNKFEEEYIKRYNTITPNGYNIRSGGNNSTHHEQTKTKISESLKQYYSINPIINKIGKKHDEQTKLRISEAMQGNYNFTEEGIEKLKKCNTKYNIHIYSLDGKLVQSFFGMVNAAKFFGISKERVHALCKTKNKIYNDEYIFKKVLIVK